MASNLSGTVLFTPSATVNIAVSESFTMQHTFGGLVQAAIAFLLLKKGR